MNYLKELQNIIETTGKYSLSQAVKRNENLYIWLLNNTPNDCTSISERVAIIQGNEYICKEGNRKKFVQGEFKYCGRANLCKCLNELITQKFSESWNSELTNSSSDDSENAKQEILNIVQKHTSKSYARLIRKRPQLMNEIENYCKDHNFQNFAEKIYCYVNKTHPKTCENNKKIPFNTFDKGYRNFCGPKTSCECARKNQSIKIKEWKSNNPEKELERKEKSKDTLEKRYGVSNPMHIPEAKEKLKQTNLEKYGTEFPLQSKEIQNKVKSTNIEKYGVEYPFQLEEIQKKSHDTAVARYGKDYMRIARDAYKDQTDYKNPFNNSEIQQKAKETMVKKYGKEHALQIDEFYNSSRNTLFKNHNRMNPAQLHYSQDVYNILSSEKEFRKYCEKFTLSELSEELNLSVSVIMSHHDKYDLNYYSLKSRSIEEDNVADWLTLNNINFERNKELFKDSKLQIDFYIPQYNLAIEYNGLYYHSEFSYGKDKWYHYNKWKMCNDLGIQLLTIWSDEWNDRKEIVQKLILYRCKKIKNTIGARKCSIKEISNNEVNEFYEKYHIQGKLPFNNYNLGAFYNDELVGCISFHCKKDNLYSLNRFATDQNYNFPGLFSKFLKFFVNNKYPEMIETFSDNRYSNGNLYAQTEFDLEYELKPDYQYTNYVIREHKFKWRKNKIKKRFNVDITGKTESELVREVKWDRIWDCGKKKWIWTK